MSEDEERANMQRVHAEVAILKAQLARINEGLDIGRRVRDDFTRQSAEQAKLNAAIVANVQRQRRFNLCCVLVAAAWGFNVVLEFALRMLS